MRILITGAAGFIGYHLAAALIAAGHNVTGVDSLNDYYDVKLKKDRLGLLAASPHSNSFHFEKLNIADKPSLEALFRANSFTHVINLAAQAGVRYSLVNPAAYVESNLTGFANLLECCRACPVEHLVFASSSSVYGLNTELPYSTGQNVDHPASLYAATKKSNELLAHSYSHLYGMPATGLRFFTVYGPWGRPDMAPYLFSSAILAEKPLKLFNNGDLMRDFTYIDDIIQGVVSVLDKPPYPNPGYSHASPDPAKSSAPWAIYNIGNNHAVPLLKFVKTLENALGKKAIIEKMPMQPGDVKATWADIEPLKQLSGFTPKMDLAEGLAAYAAWHRDYYGA